MNRYLPPNGTEGMQFTAKFCERCFHEEYMSEGEGKQCEIFNNAFLHDRPCYDKDLKKDGWEWYDRKCLQFIDYERGGDGDEPIRPIPVSPNQLVLFTFDEGLDAILNEEELTLKELK